MNRRPPREVVSLRCPEAWCEPKVFPGARSIDRVRRDEAGTGSGVQVGAEKETGLADARSTSSYLMAGLAFVVVTGVIVYAARSAAEDFG